MPQASRRVQMYVRVPNPGLKTAPWTAYLREIDSVILDWSDAVGGMWSNPAAACWCARTGEADGAVNRLRREMGRLGGRHGVMITRDSATARPIAPEPQTVLVKAGK